MNDHTAAWLDPYSILAYFPDRATAPQRAACYLEG
jgi:hypothetical protein